MEVGVATDVGAGQRSNEDAWSAEQLHKNVTLLAVADGFGRPGGVPAANLILETVRDAVRRELRRATFPSRTLSPTDVRQLLVSSFAEANDRLFRIGGGNDDCVTAASTCTAVLIINDQAFIAHVGDSRAYLLRRNELVALTNDESIVPELVRSGGRTLRLGKQRPSRPLLMRALGIEDAVAVAPKVSHYTLHARDAIALLTDGAHRAVPLADLQPALTKGETADASAQRVVALARIGGGADNATVLLARDATVHGSPAEHTRAPKRARPNRVMLLIAFLLFIVTTAGIIAWWLSDTHLYLGTDESGKVALYAGAPANFYGIPLHAMRKTYGVAADSLPSDVQRGLEHGLQVSSQAAADDFLRTQSNTK
ncbi:MAG: serine/threonine-protein phosphatase [Candidatus Eremiobacteraeota bacterium]|nr:serine/threonine-protein phosphatase [Candidatus Eremiobacteraeota bacterium]MBV8365284.1 serine/threonine-protein phosphatase [Candidatus Eremiobacteraeota bacterium]